ncbi:MAG: uL15m family ribosomal protein [Nanoarchaeota archaeon]|nr:uL15m family ribosomal protein [Nanoarchaeota archaeon]
MKGKKRRKSSRYRASQTARRGKKARTRGSGNQGGKGWAGTGKRGDQKKTLVIKLSGGNNYFGKSKTLRRGKVPAKLEAINLSQVILNLPSFIQKEKAKESKGAYEINLEGYKILGEGEVKGKLIIKASAFSAVAKEKIENAGGKAISSNEADGASE